MLTLSNVTLSRGGLTLLSNQNLQLSPGEGLIITGPNGSGKSSLLACLVGLLPHDSGQLSMRGEFLPCADSACAGYFFLGHRRGVRLDATVRENLAQDIRYEVDGSLLDAALLACGLSEKSEVLGMKLSQGQRHRVALAKLWLSDAKLWILDEPFEAIDKKMQQVLEAKLREHLSSGGSFVLSTHVSLLDATINHQSLVLGGDDA